MISTLLFISIVVLVKDIYNLMFSSDRIYTTLTRIFFKLSLTLLKNTFISISLIAIIFVILFI